MLQGSFGSSIKVSLPPRPGTGFEPPVPRKAPGSYIVGFLNEGTANSPPRLGPPARVARSSSVGCVSAPRRDPTHKLAQAVGLFCGFASGVGVPIGADWDPTVWVYSYSIPGCCLLSEWGPRSVLNHIDGRNLRRRAIEERKSCCVRRSMMSAVRAWSMSTTSSAATLIYSSICAGSVPKRLLLRAAKPRGCAGWVRSIGAQPRGAGVTWSRP
jgi:hypothetical protein